ncbi:stage III sporulation protein AG [Paenibacillus sp. HB172176]|uniref:stage III sporulation protein AG n=1 Tax=Paenibacillus sp. HB172176 TaxID=2493690 RepID=UPI00143C5959|nr:stage III sporulation protein AG [Paenibacillus sp. HB172176]
MAKWLENIESAVGGGPGGVKRVKTLRWLLIIGGLGAALMLLNSFLSFKGVEPPETEATPPPQAEETWSQSDSPRTPFEAVEQTLESRLKDILEKIVGVGSVDVLVTIDSTEETVFARNEKESQAITNESDKNGGTRHQTSITKDGQVVFYEVSGDQKPVVTKVINPKIRGILIVAMGAEDGMVRRLIMDAVEKGVNVPVNRISVVPSKQ